MRLIFCIFITVFLVGCGVETDSSAKTPTEDTTTPDDNNDTTDPTDENTTDPVVPDEDEDLGDPNADQANSDFDTRSAEKDQNACILNGTYTNAMEDSSFDPTGAVDSEHGVTISSLLRYDPDIQKTNVVVYYPDLIATPVGTQTTLYEEYYRLNFDQSWPANTNKTIYVRTPKGIDSNYFGCMRYTLSVDSASIVGQRVYRVNE